MNLINDDKIFKIDERVRYVTAMINDYNYLSTRLKIRFKRCTLKLSETHEDLKHFNSSTTFK